MILQDCLGCQGMCCRCIVVDAGRSDIPDFFKSINGLDCLGINPFLPLQEFLTLTKESPLAYYSCTKLDEKGLCSIYEDRPELCRSYPSPFDHDLLNFIFVVPWCSYRYKYFELVGHDYIIGNLSQCLIYYNDPMNESWLPGASKECCNRFTSYYHSRNKPCWTNIDTANEYFTQDVLSTYQAHFAYHFSSLEIKMKTARNAFNKAALLCYKYGISPIILWNIAALYGDHENVKGKLPFPTYIMGGKFEKFLKERLDKIILRERKMFQESLRKVGEYT